MIVGLAQLRTIAESHLRYCRTELEVLQHGVQESRLFMQQLQTLCPPSDTLRSKALAQRLNGANKTLAGLLESVSHADQQLRAAVAAASPLRRTHVACQLPIQPVVFTRSLVEAMKNAGSVLEECHRVAVETGGSTIPDLRLPVTSSSLTVRHVFASWTTFETLLEQVVADVAAARTCRPCTGAPSAATHLPSVQGVGAEQFASSVEASLQHTLLWAQEATKLQTEEPGWGAAHAVAVLKACMQAPSIDKLSCALDSCAQLAGQLAGSDAQVLALVSQLQGVLPLVRTVLVALRAALVHAVLLQVALSQLTLVMIAVFVSYVKEGFGEGVAEEQDGPDGAGVGMPTIKLLFYSAVEGCDD